MKPYLLALMLQARRTLRSPGRAVSQSFFYVIILVVFNALWRAATHSGGEIAGYTHDELIWYTLAAEAAVMATPARLIEEIGDDIGNGFIVSELLRPIAVMPMRLAAQLGGALIQAAGCLTVGVPVVWGLSGHRPSMGIFAIAVVSIALAVSCNLAAQFLFGAISFWVHDAKSAWFLFQKFIFLPGGMLLPLQLLPPLFRDVAFAAPFWTMAYAPARLMSGHFEPGLLLGQVTWLVVLFCLGLIAFARGERRVRVIGG